MARDGHFGVAGLQAGGLKGRWVVNGERERERERERESEREGMMIRTIFSLQNPDTASDDDKFVAMAVLHSEILLVSAESRKLYSWSCSDHPFSSRYPDLEPHPLVEELGLSSEKVALVVSSDVRATVVTESGRVATFYDALLRGM